MLGLIFLWLLLNLVSHITHRLSLNMRHISVEHHIIKISIKLIHLLHLLLLCSIGSKFIIINLSELFILLFIERNRWTLTIELVDFIQKMLKVVILLVWIVVSFPVSQILEHYHITFVHIVNKFNYPFVLNFI